MAVADATRCYYHHNISSSPMTTTSSLKTKVTGINGWGVGGEWADHRGVSSVADRLLHVGTSPTFSHSILWPLAGLIADFRPISRARIFPIDVNFACYQISPGSWYHLVRPRVLMCLQDYIGRALGLGAALLILSRGELFVTDHETMRRLLLHGNNNIQDTIAMFGSVFLCRGKLKGWDGIGCGMGQRVVWSVPLQFTNNGHRIMDPWVRNFE